MSLWIGRTIRTVVMPLRVRTITNSWLLLGALTLTAAGLVGVWIAAAKWNMPYSMFTRDPMALFVKGHPLLGVLSNIGILIWCVGASALAGAFFVLRGIEVKPILRALWIPSALTFMLLIDDLFMVHEFIFAHLFKISEYFLFGFYAGLTFLYLTLSARVLLERTAFPILALAGVCFVESLYIDTLPDNWSHYHYLYEDGLKFAGIVLWTTFHVAFATSLIRSRLVGAREPHEALDG